VPSSGRRTSREMPGSLSLELSAGFTFYDYHATIPALPVTGGNLLAFRRTRPRVSSPMGMGPNSAVGDNLAYQDFAGSHTAYAEDMPSRSTVIRSRTGDDEPRCRRSWDGGPATRQESALTITPMPVGFSEPQPTRGELAMKIERLEANTSTLRLLAAVFVLGSMVGISQAFYDASTDFSITNGNPNGVWSYGYSTTLRRNLRCRCVHRDADYGIGWLDGRPLRHQEPLGDEEHDRRGPGCLDGPLGRRFR